MLMNDLVGIIYWHYFALFDHRFDCGFDHSSASGSMTNAQWVPNGIAFGSTSGLTERKSRQVKLGTSRECLTVPGWRCRLHASYYETTLALIILGAPSAGSEAQRATLDSASLHPGHGLLFFL
jgi:hypothetical protein